jgi:diguanylate cyclase (GGDEF)-like protein
VTRLLIIDDSAFQARVMADILAGDGHETMICSSAEDALERFERDRPDLILTDLLLPGMNGFDLCHKLRSREGGAKVPVIVITGRDDATDRLRGLSAGADAFITRDRQPREILARVRRVLELASRRDMDAREAPVSMIFGGQTWTFETSREHLAELLVSAFEDLGSLQQQALRQQTSRSHQVQLQAQIQALNTKIERLASRDPLTDLLNLRGLEQRIVQARGLDGRHTPSFTFFLVRCTNYPATNVRLGYAVGDILLREFARRITEALSPEDLVARVGGEEFLAAVPDLPVGHASILARLLHLALTQQPVALSMEALRPTAVIGFQRLRRGPGDLTELAARLHLRLELLEQESHASVLDLDEPQADKTHDLEFFRRMERDLQEGRGLRTLFHPIFHLREQRIAAYEILSRGPRGFFELPQDFFRFCFDANILTQVDLQCLRLGVRAAEEMDDKVRFHVNLYPSTLLATPVDRILGFFPSDTSRYCIEISEEQILSDPTTLVGPVAALKAAGLQVAIDDVGFGRSWLESLLLLEPDLVKIDKRTVAGIARNPSMLRALKRLIKVSLALDAEIVAEGVECVEDFAALVELGVTYGQGFLWGGPEAADRRSSPET